LVDLKAEHPTKPSSKGVNEGLSTNIAREEVSGKGNFRYIEEGDRWKCRGCGSCCRNVFSEDWLQFIVNHGLEVGSDGSCPFLLLDTNRCRIYRDRFNPCKGFPFSLRKAADPGEYRLVVYRQCPGFGHGPVIDIEGWMDRLTRLSDREFERPHKTSGIKHKDNYYVISLGT
jgi:Fe-S-cluster containining protein